MGTATVHSLRDRLTPPRSRDTAGFHVGATPAVERLLCLVNRLFKTDRAVLVMPTPGAMQVVAASADPGPYEADAVATAALLFETLAVSEGGSRAGTGVLEDLTLARGFLAATPILSKAGRCEGALCLIDPNRRTLLTGLQRRLLAEVGDLVAVASRVPAEASATKSTTGSALQDLADRDPEAFALFDPDGRCLLRNGCFDSLLGHTGLRRNLSEIAGAQGREAEWLATRIARDVAPVEVYRATRPDGTRLRVEQRRSPHGHSLLARVEANDAFGGNDDLRLLFDRCPLPMVVFDGVSRAILAANGAALDLYGWERDALIGCGVDVIGPVDPDPEATDTRPHTVSPPYDWIHRSRDGRPLAVAGRSIVFDHGAVLVTVVPETERVA